MKKLLSLALAVLMLAGVAAPAFAATTYKNRGEFVQVDMDSADGSGYLIPGSTYRFRLDDGSNPIDEEFYKDFSTTIKVLDGKEYATAKIEKVGARYYLVVTPKSSGKYLGESHQFEIRITVRGKGLNAKDYRDSDGNIEYPEWQTDVTFDIDYPDGKYLHDGDHVVDNDEPILIAGDAARVKLIFGNVAEYDARFSSNEKKYNATYSLAEDGLVVKNNPNAKLKFIAFTGNPNFPGNFALRVYMTSAQYLYQIQNDKLVLLDADRKDGYMEYRTDELRAYVVSDRPLTGGAGGKADSGGSSTDGVITGSDLSDAKAKQAAEDAAAQARASGSKTASVRFVAVNYMTKELLNALPTFAGMPVNLIVDTMSASGSAVDVRISLNPVYSTAPLNLLASTYSAQAASTKSFFETWFTNKIAVVSLSQKSAFGQTVSIAAKVDLSNMNTSNLHFYAYNSTTNSYDKLTAPAYFVDTAGYLHFNTMRGGEIVVSDGVLQSR